MFGLVLARDGYIFLRSLLPDHLVRSARSVVMRTLHEEWHIIDDSGPIEEGKILNDSRGVLLTGYRAVTHHPDMLRLCEGTELTSFLSKLFAAPPSTYDLKWCRVMGGGEFTDEHTDFFRFAGQAQNMVTCWYVVVCCQSCI